MFKFLGILLVLGLIFRNAISLFLDWLFTRHENLQERIDEREREAAKVEQRIQEREDQLNNQQLPPEDWHKKIPPNCS